MNTSNSRVAWFHCFAGIAGDMALGSMIDAGADLDEVKKLCALLDIEGYEITATATERNGITATQIEVNLDPATKQSHRTAQDIYALIQNASLPPRVEQRALKTFQALAVAEGKIHNKPPEQVHFHEVGAVDSIIDIVGTAAALECLDIDIIYASPVAQGVGTIQCEHGTMPNPPPAVVELLKGVPIYGVDIAHELTTPTGAALLAALVESYGALPEMKIQSTGYGAGNKEFPELPNLTQIIIGEKIQISDTQFSNTGSKSTNRGQPVMVLETNLDDVTGEVLADTISNLLDRGALDVWVTPILMKKGRPAHTVSALVDIADQAQITDLLIDLTGTLGVRAYGLERWPQPRRQDTINVEGHIVRVKYSKNKAKPEHEDLVAVAKATGKSLRQVQKSIKQVFKQAGNNP